MLSLQERYKNEVIPALKEELGIVNELALPRLEKVCVNVGLGYDGVADSKVLEYVTADLAAITGQKPVITKARKAVSNFKVRIGMPIGAKVTLRNRLMFNFADKLINVVMPLIRDFRGVPASFDHAGNFAVGLREHVLFPEIDIEDVKYHFGMDVNFVIKNGSRDGSHTLLKLMGMPFEDVSEKAG